MAINKAWHAANPLPGGASVPDTEPPRCSWATADPLYRRYHDEEWGTPSHDDRHLFEMLILEGAQAGLSWITILRKRDNFRAAFDGFDIDTVAEYGDAEVERLMADAGIVRNRAKIEAAIANARAAAALDLTELIWSFAPAPRGRQAAVPSRRPAAAHSDCGPAATPS